MYLRIPWEIFADSLRSAEYTLGTTGREVIEKYVDQQTFYEWLYLHIC
jgi:hypothetical protein